MVQKGDFIKLEYTGYDANGAIFDSTSGDVAKNLHGKEGPLLIVFGYDKLIGGLEEALQAMKKGEEKDVEIPPEKAFGERSKNLIRVLSEVELLKNKINPQVGLTLELQTDQGMMYGVVKAINSGRVTVDFNHPLASKTVNYKVKLLDIIEGKEDKVGALADQVELKATPKFNNEKLTLEVAKEPSTEKEKQESHAFKKEYLVAKIKAVIPEIKDVETVDV